MTEFLPFPCQLPFSKLGRPPFSKGGWLPVPELDWLQLQPG
jgi:hypothetical protein